MKIAIISAGLAFTACGKNYLQNADPPSAAELAAKALESGSSVTAANIILAELGGAYNNLYLNMGSLSGSEIEANFRALNLAEAQRREPSALWDMISVLSSAHAQRFKIDPFDIGLALLDNPSGGEAEGAAEGSGSFLTIFFPVLPEATAENRQGLAEALAILNSIGLENLDSADRFKQALLLMANVSLITKGVDANQDGVLDVNDILGFDEDSAQQLIELLVLSEQAVGRASEGGEAAAAQLSTINAELADSEGSAVEKVQTLFSGETP